MLSLITELLGGERRAGLSGFSSEPMRLISAGLFLILAVSSYLRSWDMSRPRIRYDHEHGRRILIAIIFINVLVLELFSYANTLP